MSEPFDAKLLERLKHKHSDLDATQFSVLDFLGPIGSPLHALMYARLFWPDFVELDGMVFRQEVMADDLDYANARRMLSDVGGDREQLEKILNLTEIPSAIFSKAVLESTDEEDRMLAKYLCEMWSARLAQVFPDRSFLVELVEPEDTGGEIGVVFFQPRSNAGTGKE